MPSRSIPTRDLITCPVMRIQMAKMDQREMSHLPNTNETDVPQVYKNWLSSLAGNSLDSASEFPLFTDATVIGAIMSGLGPYQILNTVPTATRRMSSPALVLRIDYHLGIESLPEGITKTKTSENHYHGGRLTDESASLVSLCLGMRLKAGGCTRDFYPGSDPRGRPSSRDAYRDPIPTTANQQTAVLPYTLGERRLNGAIDSLQSLTLLSPASATAIVKAARLYQEAVWISESEPHLSWIMLVSAIEVAALHWRTATGSPVKRLEAAKPELAAILQEAGGDDLLTRVAEQISDSLGATKKFVDFVLEFLPNPPEKRPPEKFQLSWDRNVLKETLRTVYGWRSRALHGGIQFPYTMCESPIKFGFGYCEKPGGGTSAFGAYWTEEDTPIYLHTFEYIVRNALLKWWASMAEESSIILQISILSERMSTQ